MVVLLSSQPVFLAHPDAPAFGPMIFWKPHLFCFQSCDLLLVCRKFSEWTLWILL